MSLINNPSWEEIKFISSSEWTNRGELKVLHNNSNKGFIIRTKNTSDNISPLEILTTNGTSSYKYDFPLTNGTVSLNIDLGGIDNFDNITTTGTYSGFFNSENEVTNITTNQVVVRPFEFFELQVMRNNYDGCDINVIAVIVQIKKSIYVVKDIDKGYYGGFSYLKRIGTFREGVVDWLDWGDI
jgi:hypothetical protein